MKAPLLHVPDALPRQVRGTSMFFSRKSAEMPLPGQALKGRPNPIPTAAMHAVFGQPLKGPFPAQAETVFFGMGCFWGAERIFWQLPRGILMTSVGYQAGQTPNPTYDEVCSGRTGHNETVQVVYDPTEIGFGHLLKTFWESHDPTQGMRQGNDAGTQYRSGIYTTTVAQQAEAMASQTAFNAVLGANSFGPSTTEIMAAPEYYFAEDYHQQYLKKVPNGYCGLGGTGLTCPIGSTARTPAASGAT
jgi:peptide-methionine (S)-S-oxide reductase